MVEFRNGDNEGISRMLISIKICQIDERKKIIKQIPIYKFAEVHFVAHIGIL